MRNLTRAFLALALLAGAVPTGAQACIIPLNCPVELDLEEISCKAEPGIDTPAGSTCAGWVSSADDRYAPRAPVDVSGFVDIGVDHWSLSISGAVAVQVLRDGAVPIWSDARRVRIDDDDDFSVRNLPSHLLPVLFNRCVTDDPATREFRVALSAITRLDPHRWPESKPFTLRIAPDGYVNPPHCA